MAITKKEAGHVARLARLGASEDELETFAAQLSAILEYAGMLNKMDTKNVQPASHAIPLKNVLREDKVVPCEDVEAIIANAPEEEVGMFRVPKIME